MAVTKKNLEVRADLSAEREAQASSPVTQFVAYRYRYIGSTAVVVVVTDEAGQGQAYDARPGDTVTLPGAVNHPDFVRVRGAK